MQNFGTVPKKWSKFAFGVDFSQLTFCGPKIIWSQTFSTLPENTILNAETHCVQRKKSQLHKDNCSVKTEFRLKKRIAEKNLPLIKGILYIYLSTPEGVT